MRFFDRPYVLLTLAILFWSGNFVLGRAIRADIPPIALSFWRWACAAFVIVWFALPHMRHDWPLIRRHWPILLLFAFLGVTMFNTLVYSGLQVRVRDQCAAHAGHDARVDRRHLISAVP